MAYVEEKAPSGCIFCAKPDDQDDAASLILHRGTHAFIILNAYPYNNGHMMIAPYRHTADLEGLTDDESREMMELCQRGVAALRRVYSPDGYNIGMNLGLAAGAGIADHLHLHIVPRWNGDTNFMPVVADTKVLPDALRGTYDKLRGPIADNDRG
jgi:ATP adenylyltransferase